MKEKITFVIPSLGSGGAERVISILSNELVSRGFPVSIVLTANDRINYLLSGEVNCIALNCEKKYAQSNPFERYLGRIGDIRKTLKESDPDVIISFMANTNIDVCLAAMGLDIPVIVSERNDPALDPPSRIKQFLRKLAYLRANGFVFQTPDAKAFFGKRIQKKSEIILNPLKTQLPTPFVGQRDKRIVAVGRLHEQKNYPLLLDSFSQFVKLFPDYMLEIYGEGPLEEEIRNRIHSMGIEEKVILKGFCKDVAERIHTAAFFVMTSDFEGLPNALIEAMAQGLPCISTDCRCGGPRMLIQHGVNGILVPTGNSDALMKAMIELAENPERAKKLGMQAQKLDKRVDTRMITEQWIAYISRVKANTCR